METGHQLAAYDPGQQLQVVQPHIPAIDHRKPHYAEAILATDNTRLAACLRVFQAQLMRGCPFEWVDIHKDRESFVRYLEEEAKRENGEPYTDEFAPKPKVTFNFDARTIPGEKVVQAFDKPLHEVDGALEMLLSGLPQDIRNEIRDAVSRLLVRACHEALLRREELVKWIKAIPHNAKYDSISHGARIVRLGKNCSAETREHFLKKLP